MLSSTEEAESILPSLTIFSNQIYLMRSKQNATIISDDGGGGEGYFDSTNSNSVEDSLMIT